MLVAMAGLASSADRSGGAVTFHRDVLPILQKRCQECHRPGEIGPMPLLSYRDVRPWAKAIREAVLSGKMPPWPADSGVGRFRNDGRLASSEIKTLTGWAESGAIEGDPGEAPPRREFFEGWRIGRPDLVFEMPEAYEVPASGVVEYTYVILPSGFTEDRWIQLAEIRPGNRAVVHHSSAWIRPKESRWLGNHRPGKAFVPVEQTRRDPTRLLASTFAGVTPLDEALVGYAPGRSPGMLPPGQAILVPAHADFVFQLHYTPNGKAATDRSRLGLVFAKRPPVERVFRGGVSNDTFVIPAGATNHRVNGAITVNADCKLISMRPHMHLRGKAMEFRAVYPTGESELLLRVPRYDFNWQFDYVLEHPKLLPKGTRIEVVGVFDNSRNNPANPDPAAEVRWGDQTWEEMMTGQFELRGYDEETTCRDLGNDCVIVGGGTGPGHFLQQPFLLQRGEHDHGSGDIRVVPGCARKPGLQYR